MATHLHPVLKAQDRGQKRWCGWCLRLTPDQNLNLCQGCLQVGYCNRECCQKRDWGEGGHKGKCAAVKADAARVKGEKKAGEGGGVGGRSGGGAGGGGGIGRGKGGEGGSVGGRGGGADDESREEEGEKKGVDTKSGGGDKGGGGVRRGKKKGRGGRR